MHLMSEYDRIVRPGGHVVLTTPNIAFFRGISAILEGFHPGLFRSYIKPQRIGRSRPAAQPRVHAAKIHQLLENSGFEVTLLETGVFARSRIPSTAGCCIARALRLRATLRGEGTYGGAQTGAVRERYPGWLYS